jgi:membrane-associated PAP2 superfamily phosphatase
LFDFYGSALGRIFFRRQLAWLAASAAAILLIFQLSDVDRAIAHTFFDAQRNAFPLKHDRLLEKVLHRGARSLSVLCALAVLVACVASWAAPQRFARLVRWRVELTFLAGALLAAPLVVGALKHFSTHACPWDIAGFGGAEAYRRLLEPLRGVFGADGCLPAAHPVSGFAWLALALVVYPRDRVRARILWWTALAVGLVLGLVQMARGAHFLSHVLLSAWVVWGVDVALLAWTARWWARRVADPAAPDSRITLR